ncbi:MAG TPA: hypothetical protein VMF06_21610 [Candidatus Limnocylindria bacterium]|nr:hypothetical protein [Candidatus Limnocylindria bacterium]
MNRHRTLKLLGLASAIVVVLCFAATATVSARTTYTCILCRTEHVDRSVLGYHTESFHENPFTEWHQAHFTNHTHTWCRLTTLGSGILVKSHACGPRHPVADLLPEWEMDYATHASDADLKAFFEEIVSSDKAIQEHGVKQVTSWITRTP